MTAITTTVNMSPAAPPVDNLGRRLLGSGRVMIGGAIVLLIALACIASLPWTSDGGVGGTGAGTWYYDRQEAGGSRLPPDVSSVDRWFGTDVLGRSLLARCLFGGCISLAIGLAAAVISMVLGVGVGLLAGYRGGWTDAILMRLVDILYGLPYILIIVLLKFALEPIVIDWLTALNLHVLPDRLKFPPAGAANVITMFIAIGSVSWLTMARVVRGQVLSLRNQPFIEAARAAGLTEMRIFGTHLLPNLIGPVIVYATLTVPRAILEESLLSFLGVGVQPPVPTWGSLASDGIGLALNPVNSRWWLLLFPCSLLAVTLLALNFLGDGLRDVLDPKRGAARM
ncbi:MAG TPA: ABC transporter permease [Tepidisphaeraceae bacterium]|jgi:oligopeptide transport system permease protein|nr:ABC transporter permease [Tepidisphaeraceae bacterium]